MKIHTAISDPEQLQVRNIELAIQALRIDHEKTYLAADGTRVDVRKQIDRALRAKVSIPPWEVLSPVPTEPSCDTEIGVTRETTLQAAKRLFEEGEMPMALNFANGLQPGGGFLLGANAQEESLCRCSALYLTLLGDEMYAAHKALGNRDSSSWAILSPEVPVFADGKGVLEPIPWPLGILTCSAPVATPEAVDRTARLMASRINRVLHIAVQYGYGTLVLGAWGCGAFGNDPHRIAGAFHQSLHGRFAGQFDRVVFAIADDSPESSCLEAFRNRFTPFTP